MSHCPSKGGIKPWEMGGERTVTSGWWEMWADFGASFQQWNMPEAHSGQLSYLCGGGGVTSVLRGHRAANGEDLDQPVNLTV